MERTYIDGQFQRKSNDNKTIPYSPCEGRNGTVEH